MKKEQPLTAEELAGLPKIFAQAQERARQRAITREQLHKYDGNCRPRVLGQHVGYGLIRKQNGFDDVVKIKKLDEYQKDQMQMVAKIMETNEPNFSDVRNDRRLDIPQAFQEIIKEIEKAVWLADHERKMMRDVFISDFGARFYDVVTLLQPHHFPARKKRAIVTRVYDIFHDANTLVLEKCREKKMEMERLNVMKKENNMLRLQALYRTELKNRVNTEKIVKRAIRELESGAVELSHDFALKMELRRFKEALSEVSELKKLKDAVPYDPKLLARVEEKEKEKEQAMVQTKFDAKQRLVLEREVAIRNDLAALMKPVQNKHSPVRGYDEEDLDEAPAAAEMEDVHFQGVKNMIEKEELLLKMSGIPKTRKVSSAQKIEPVPAPRHRYLIPSPERKEFLLDWDEFEEMIANEAPDSLEILTQAPNSNSVNWNSRYTERITRGTVHIEMEPVYGTQNMNSLTINDLEAIDEVMVQSKRVDELFEEYLQDGSDRRFEFLEDSLLGVSVPPAPNDLLASISYAYNGLSNLEEITDLDTDIQTLKSSNFGDSETATVLQQAMASLPSTSRTKSARAVAARFSMLGDAIHDSNNMFIDTPAEWKIRSGTSSELENLRKLKAAKLKNRVITNQGFQTAEVPLSQLEKEKLIVMSMEDYLKFLRTRATDFLVNTIIPMEELHLEASLSYLDVNTDSNESSDEDLGLPPVDAVEFTKGLWTFEKAPEVAKPLAEEEEEESYSRDKRSRKKSAPKAAEVTIPVIQARLEAIWTRMHMPPKEKVEMVVKYTGSTHPRKLKQAFLLWEAAATLIEQREQLLPHVMEMEVDHADPNRFKMQDAQAREEENHRRSWLLRRLRKLDKNLSKIIEKIFKSYGDVVTYKGASYAERIVHDYSSIQYEAQQEYRRRPKLPKISQERASVVGSSIPEDQEEHSDTFGSSIPSSRPETSGRS